MVRLTREGDFALDQTMRATYFSLRRTIVLVAVTLPPLLWWGGYLAFGIHLQDSIGAYYTTAIRDWFVGCLFGVAACLYVYKGLSDRESFLLNMAALFAVGVAVNPLDWKPAWLPDGLTPHGICAVLFFAMIALACWLCQDDSLRLGLVPPDRVARYRAKYTLTGIALVALPVVASTINTGVPGRAPGSSIFRLEAVAVWVFSFYWYTKTGELQKAIERTTYAPRANRGTPEPSAEAHP
jgi:hypothetical protein